MARLLSLGVVVCALLGGLELLARAFPDGLAALSHRVHFKLALLRAKGPVDFVVLGSSRSNDGVGPRHLGLGVGFSAATPSSSLQTLEYFATHLGPQKLVFVELSVPQSTDKPMEDVALAPTQPSDPAVDPFGAWLDAHSALLRVRRAFALENLPRVGALLFATRLDGSEWLRTRFLAQYLSSEAPLEGVQDDAAWVPDTRVDALAAEDGDLPRVLAGYERVVTALRASGAQVVLVGPPLGASWRGDECTPARVGFRAAVARQVQAPLLDFTCREVDERWFVEGQHLSTRGRARWSRALGEAYRALP
ncbi:MAG: hypothetical protein ACOZQL_30040 [Myxococcota bacterium]